MKLASPDRSRPLAGALLAALFVLAFPRASLAELAHPVVEKRLAAAVTVLARALGGLSSALREEVRDTSGAAYSFNDVT